MEINDALPHGVIILQGGRLVYANDRIPEITGLSSDELSTFSEKEILSFIQQTDRERIEVLISTARRGEPVFPEVNVCLQRKDGAKHWLDFTASTVIYQGDKAVQINWIDKYTDKTIQENYNQYHLRLQAHLEIEKAILSSLDAANVANTALGYIQEILPNYSTGFVFSINSEKNSLNLITSTSKRAKDKSTVFEIKSLDDLNVDINSLRDGFPLVIPDLNGLPVMNAIQSLWSAMGISSYLVLPMRGGGELIGILVLTADDPVVTRSNHLQIAQEMADSLAIAFGQSRLREVYGQQNLEAWIMRDILAALASAGNLQQTLEIILVNLHNLIHYDRAGMFLADENKRYVLAERLDMADDGSVRFYLGEDPLVLELRESRKPIIVSDVQKDPRFTSWPDMEALHGWLGAPLFVEQEMIGFLTLGSLNVAAYNQTDAEIMALFTSQVADVLEKAMLYELSSRRTEELEVLSSFTMALGQAESREDTLSAIVEQIAQFFEADLGVFLMPDSSGSTLAIKISHGGSVTGLSHPLGDDLLGRVFHGGQMSVLTDVKIAIRENPHEIYHVIFGGMESGIVVSLNSNGSTFGILCFGFRLRQRFSPEKIRLYDTVVKIASTSFQRAVMLEGLENQVNIRTQHLSTLYDINAVSSEPTSLDAILNQVLEITLESMNSKDGAIHILDQSNQVLQLIVAKSCNNVIHPGFESLSIEEDFWNRLIHSKNPLVIPDAKLETNLPPVFDQTISSDIRAYIGAPIRTKGKSLGLLSIFGQTVLANSIEDITLFMTIADQIGSIVERTRLIETAEQAAVFEERQRLARELHDSVTQLIYSQVLFTGASLKELNLGNQELVKDHLTRIDQTAQQALKEMRLLVYQLGPSDTLELGLVGALQRRLDAVEKRTGIQAELNFKGEIDLDETVELGLFRIAEEALNNTLKHAGATSIVLNIQVERGNTYMLIEDNGRGFDVAAAHKGSGMGLTTMGDRAAALGGELELISVPDQGTKVKVIIEE